MKSVPELVVDRTDFRPAYERAYSVRNEHGVTVGRLELQGPIPVEGVKYVPDEGCRKSFEALMRQYPELAGVWAVRLSEVDWPYRGRGVGRELYERALLDAARENRAIIPDLCLDDEDPDGAVHETSDAARRVWRSLWKEYPREGYVTYGKLP